MAQSSGEALATVTNLSDVIGEDSTQYLTFLLAGEHYGVDVLTVREIKGWDSVTPIPNAPAFVKGVINIRGAIVPIVDLRIRFGLEPQPYSPTTVVIILRAGSDGMEKTVGVVVDAVSDVYVINDQQRKPAPEFGEVVDTDFVMGLVTIESTMIVLLDIDRLIIDGILGKIGA